MAGKEHKYIAFAVFPGLGPLDLIGPMSVLRDLKLRSPYRTCVVSQRTEHLATDSPIKVAPAHTFDSMPRPFALFVPGGPGAVEAAKDEHLLSYVRLASEGAQFTGSMGSGALVLAAAGLLQGRRAATHWRYADHLDRHGVQYADERWVEDGKYLTSAGGSAGVDMMLYLVSRLTSVSVARLTQIFVEYDPHPPFSQMKSGAKVHAMAGPDLEHSPAGMQREGIG